MVLTSFNVSELSRFAHWLEVTPLGEYIRREEQQWFDNVTADIFGYKAMQLQLPRLNFLRQSRIPWRMCAAEEGGGALQCSSYMLPIANQSLDLLVLPHVLDFAPYPQAVLREAERVLMPEGRLLLTGFNPWSLWAWRRLWRCDPWRGNWLTLPRLKDWLSLMGFESMQGSYFGYTLPLQNVKWMEYSQSLNKAGDRWWPAAGAVYCLDMVKRIRGVKIIKPHWSTLAVTNVITATDISCKINTLNADE